MKWRREELPGKGQAGCALGRDDHFEARFACQAQDDPRLVRVVFDDEQYGVALDDVLAIIRNVLFAGHREDAGGMGSWNRLPPGGQR